MSDEVCPIQQTLELIGGKWKIQILYNIKQSDVIRFNELKRAIPLVSQKVLTSQLRELEASGFVSRKVYPEVPPKVEYTLTRKGQSLYPVLDSISDWASKNL